MDGPWRAGFIELGQAPLARSSTDKHERVSPGPPRKPGGHAFAGQRVADPTAGVAGKGPGSGYRGTERRAHPSDVQALAAGQDHERAWAVDLAGRERLDLDQPVDRWVARHADDHPLPPASPSVLSASASVGCAGVPPLARVDSAPQAHPSASARSSGWPSSSAASTPASNESRPHGVDHSTDCRGPDVHPIGASRGGQRSIGPQLDRHQRSGGGEPLRRLARIAATGDPDPSTALGSMSTS